jgi:class 3 adenylate cyclase
VDTRPSRPDPYQVAIGEVLRRLGRAPVDLDGVFDAILRHALELTRSSRGFVYLLEDDGRYHHVADVGAPPEVVAFNRAHPIVPSRATCTGRTALEGRPVHIPDALADPDYHYTEAQQLGGFRTLLGVPMLRDGVVSGVIDVYRDTPEPYTDAEIDLVALFADQATLALELSRLTSTIERQRSELSRFLAPQVSALIASEAGERLLAGHRREITVVFADLRGFTAFSESAAPEDVLDVLRGYHETLGAGVAEFGGTLERFTGDGLMVFFNDPVEQADHAERAVRMAFAWRERVAGLSRSWRRLGFDLGFGVGIATGYATLGRIGFQGRVDYAAIGSVVNLAARLCAEAADGTILAAARTVAAVEELVVAELLDALALKGFARPVAVARLSGLRAQVA